MIIRLIILFTVMFIIDTINHFGLKAMLSRLKGSYAYKFIITGYWGMSIAVVVVFFVALGITGYPQLDYVKYRVYFFLFGFWLIFYLPRFIFAHFVILQGIFYVIKSIIKRKNSYAVKRIKRNNFFISKFGLIIAFSSSILVIYGMIWGKSDFKVNKVDIYLEDLPTSFEGFKIAQFSDAHLGSFTNATDVRKGLSLLQNENPDIIVFTGDMVNNIADEIEPYFADLSKLHAPCGKFSILGNHDMSDYVKWKNFEIKQEYINKLIKYEETCGFTLLLNQNQIIRKEKDSIVLIGVENWGLPPFKQYGDLAKAMNGIQAVETKILLSHDPTHWSQQVIKTDINLTLSGHTHGMQMGINLIGIRWSPIQFMYKNWIGLYQEDKQFLYVNPGFGFIGFPGRIGIRPEITLIILHKKES